MFDVLLAWNFDPLITLLLAVAAALYIVGWRRLSARARATPVLPRWRAWLYGMGLGVIVLALLSPIDTFDTDLFWDHMVQHLLLIQVAAPLILLGAPALPLLWGLPEQERRGLARIALAPASPLARLGHLLTVPLVACGLLVGTIAFWHLPPFYDAAQGPTFIHTLEHVMFFTAALIFWWPIIHPSGGRRRLGFALAIPYLLPPMIEGMVIGALLTFAAVPVYTTYQLAPRVSGLSVMQDQQIGGLIMWIPSGMVYIGAIFFVLYLALTAEERDVRAAEAAERLAVDPALMARPPSPG